MQFNRSTNRPQLPPGDALIVAKVFALLEEIADHGHAAVVDALADARASVAERANELSDPIRRTFAEMKLDPLVKDLAPLVGADPAAVAAVAYAVLLPSKAAIVLDVVRRHAADLRPKLKVSSSNGRTKAGRRRA